MNRMPRPDDLLNDPASSRWVIEALRTALQRDPIDAANDAELVAAALAAHAADLLALAAQRPQTRGLR
jgi:hypothetical protein